MILPLSTISDWIPELFRSSPIGFRNCSEVYRLDSGTVQRFTDWIPELFLSSTIESWNCSKLHFITRNFLGGKIEEN